MDIDLLQGLITSIPKQQLVADRLAPAVEASLRDRVLAVEEALEKNNDRLNQILGLLKKEKERHIPCVKSASDEDATKPERASRTKTKTKKRAPSPSLSSSSEGSTCSTSPEKEKKRKDPAKKYSSMSK